MTQARKPQKNKQIELIVMRITDMIFVHPDQDNTRVCATCGKQVGIYPSGQAVLATDPTIRITCNVCHISAGPVSFTRLAPGAELEPYMSRRAKR